MNTFEEKVAKALQSQRARFAKEKAEAERIKGEVKRLMASGVSRLIAYSLAAHPDQIQYPNQ